MKKIIFLILILISTGCWNYSELNEIAITTGIAIDWEDDKYKVSALVSNAQKAEGSSKEGEAQISVYEGTGKTISEALKNIERKLPKELYLRHISIVIFGEELAQKGVKNILDFLIRDPNSPNKFNILLAKDAKAGDVLKIISPLESFPSQNVSLMLTNASKFIGIAVEVSYNDFIKAYLDDGINPYLPSITIKGDVEDGKSEKNTKQSEPKTYLALNNLAIFKEDKLIGYTTEEESIGINIINQNLNQMRIYTEINGKDDSDKDNYVVTNITSLNSKIEIDENKKITINVKATGYITEANTTLDLTEEKNIKKIEEKTKNKLKSIIKKGIKKVQESKSDVFGLGNMYYKKYPKKWKKLNKDWDSEILPTLEFDIKTEINLKTKGTSNKTIEEVQNKNE